MTEAESYQSWFGIFEAAKCDAIGVEMLNNLYTTEELNAFKTNPFPLNNNLPTPQVIKDASKKHAVAKHWAKQRGLVLKSSPLCRGVGIFNGSVPIKAGTPIAYATGTYTDRVPDPSLHPQGILELKYNGERAPDTGLLWMCYSTGSIAGYVNCPHGPLHLRASRKNKLKSNIIVKENLQFPMEDVRHCTVLYFHPCCRP